MDFDPGQDASGGPAYVSVTGSSVELQVAGNILSGNVALTRAGGGLQLAVSAVTFELRDSDPATGARGPPLLRLTNGSGQLRVTTAGIAGGFGGNASILVGGVSPTPIAFQVLVNTTSAPSGT